MKNNIAEKISIAFFTVVLAAASSVSIRAQRGGEIEAPPVGGIVGAWETTVQPRNCNTWEALGQPFPGLLTINAGGTVAEYGANPATPYRTPGHGIWSSEGTVTYSMRFSFIPLTPQGMPIGRLRVTQTVTLPAFSNESTSTGSFVLTNFAGAVIGTGCSSATAVRLR